MNGAGGGGGALNHLPVLFCKSVYFIGISFCSQAENQQGKEGLPNFFFFKTKYHAAENQV